MARLFIDGFETGNPAGFWQRRTTWDAMVSGSPPTGMSGSYYAQMDDDTAWIDLPSTKAAIYMAFKWKPATSVNRGMFQFYDSAGTCMLSVRQSGSVPNNITLSVRLGNYSATEIDVTTTLFSSSNVYLFEMKYVPLNSGGIVQIKVDGVLTEVDYSGDTTAGLEYVSSIMFGTHAGTYTGGFYFDDLVIDDADWIGNTSIQKLQVEGAGASTQLDPSTGSNYACVDEIPRSDTDYIYTNTSNEIDTYTCFELTGTIGSIKCVQIDVRGKFDGAPTPTTIAPVIRRGGVNYSGEFVSPGLSWTETSKLWENDPSTSSPWEEANLNSGEIGIKCV